MRIRIQFLLMSAATFLAVAPLAGQTLEDVVVNAAETHPAGTSGTQLIWTLGELMVEYYPNGKALDQGFLQPRFIVTPVEEPSAVAPDWTLSAWPNPVGDARLHVAATAGLQLVLFDALGHVLEHATSTETAVVFDFSARPAGSYWLRATDENGRGRTLQIQKL